MRGRRERQPGSERFSAPARSRYRRVPAGSRPRHHRLLRPAQGIGQHLGSEPASRARHGGEGIRHRPFHGRGSLRRAGRARSARPGDPEPRPRSSMGACAGGCDRARTPLRGGRPGGGFADRELRRVIRWHPAPHGRLWQLAWLPGRLRRHQPLSELFPHRPAGRGDATRLLVHQCPRSGRSGIGRADRPEGR